MRRTSRARDRGSWFPRDARACSAFAAPEGTGAVSRGCVLWGRASVPPGAGTQRGRQGGQGSQAVDQADQASLHHRAPLGQAKGAVSVDPQAGAEGGDQGGQGGGIMPASPSGLPGTRRCRQRSVAGKGRASGACCFAGKLRSPAGPAPSAMIGAVGPYADPYADLYADPYARDSRTPSLARRSILAGHAPSGGVEGPRRKERCSARRVTT
jgi:hypothetical protein